MVGGQRVDGEADTVTSTVGSTADVGLSFPKPKRRTENPNKHKNTTCIFLITIPPILKQFKRFCEMLFSFRRNQTGGLLL